MTDTKPSAGRVMIVDDTPTNIDVLVDCLLDNGFDAYVATDGESALGLVQETAPDVILLDVMMPGLDGFETCTRLKADARTRDIPVIFMTALHDTADKVRAFGVGAVDYVTKPLQHDEVVARVTTHVSLHRLQVELEKQVEARTAELRTALEEVDRLRAAAEAENVVLKEELENVRESRNIVGEHATLEKTLKSVRQVARTDSTVLILGETGTGKELIARAIHDESARIEKPMVKVNCAALPANLIESELFGHERGAFTGALSKKIGRFELADGGTIFLDEIGDLPLELQAKLLRVLQEGEFERLGSADTLHVDVRVVAATNRDLMEAIAEGTFREDLYYRLAVFPIRLPPLRERLSDIPALVEHFATKFARKMGKAIREIPTETIERLQRYSFPGNVRELENVVERAVIVSENGRLDLAEWPPIGRTAPKRSASTLEEIEKQHIIDTLEMTGWRVSGPSGAARILDINPKTLESRMKKLGIARPTGNARTT